MSKKMSTSATSFWLELRRRRVISATVAYVIGAWILVEGTNLVQEILNLPPWVPKAVLVIAVLALPLVIILAWMFNIERDTAKGDESSPVELLEPDQAERQDEHKVPPSLTSAIASIAVLPFENLSSDADHKFLADGIALELHSTLAKMHRLRVAARTSTFLFADSETDVQELARKLNVHFIISGSVRCVEDRMRVIVELDNALEGVQIWSETYDREVSDVFSVQHDIAHAVVNSFGGARLREEISNATVHPTPSLDAWSLVQRARSYVLAFTAQALADAVPLLRHAIELDVGYAAAHAALANVLAEQVLNGLSLDVDDDSKAALESAEHAFAQAPMDPFVLKMCGAVWAYFGKTDMSISALRRAVDIAPFDFGSWGYMGWPLVETGAQRDLDELHEIMERIIQVTPQHPGVPYWLYHRSVACTCAGQDELAVELARQSVERNPAFPWGWMHYANTLGRIGKGRETEKAIERIKDISPALTSDHYEHMINEMSASRNFAAQRLDGLRELKLIGS